MARCGSCHTMKAAGTRGLVGGTLDGVRLNAAAIATVVRDGGGGMPAFRKTLTPAQVDAVSAFVAAKS